MKKIPIWKNIVLIVSLLVAIIIATLSWFYSGPRATANDMPVDVGEASFIQISSDNGTSWSEGLEMDIGINKNFKEISGDGTNFFAPVYDVVENAAGILTPTIIAFEKVNENENYYEQIFTFRADATQDIYLSPESYVTSVSNHGNSYIDGAVRVAFFELDENDNETLKCIWAPNSTIEYSKATNSFTKDGNVEANYYYQKSVTPVDANALTGDSINPNMAMITTGGTSGSDACSDCGYNETHKFMWSCGKDLPQNAPSLLTVNVGGGEDIGYKRMKIKVWLEGHDRECVSLLNGQKFTMKFQFNAERGE